MININKSQWAVLETWNSKLFLIAGVLLVPFAASLAVEGLMNLPEEFIPEDVFSGVGFTIAFLGLLGLYPGVAERRPWLARTGAVLAALGAVSFAVVFLVNLADFAGLLTDPPTLVGAIIFIGNILALVVGFLVFGIAILRSGVYSRTVGLLLLAPPVVFVLNFVRITVRGGPENIAAEVSAVFALGQVLAILAIGYSLRIEPSAMDRAGSAPEPTAE